MSQPNPSEVAAPGATEAEHHHPRPAFYVLIGVILTAITAVEVSVFYIESLHRVAPEILVPLSSLKFILVVLFYMHLRFDSKLFTGVFVAPLVLAVAAVVSLLILFKVLAHTPPI